jgi:hypothetical protein
MFAIYADESQIWGNFRLAGISRMAATAITPRVIHGARMTRLFLVKIAMS